MEVGRWCWWWSNLDWNLWGHIWRFFILLRAAVTWNRILFSLVPWHNPRTLSFSWLLQHSWAHLARADLQWVTSWMLGQAAPPHADICPKTKGSLSNARLHTSPLVWAVYLFTNMKLKCSGLSENTYGTGSQWALFINAWNVITFVKKLLMGYILHFCTFQFSMLFMILYRNFKKIKRAS